MRRNGNLLCIPGHGQHCLIKLCCRLQACWIWAREGKCTCIGCGHSGAEWSAADRMHRPLCARYVATVSVDVRCKQALGCAGYIAIYLQVQTVITTVRPQLMKLGGGGSIPGQESLLIQWFKQFAL